MNSNWKKPKKTHTHTYFSKGEKSFHRKVNFLTSHHKMSLYVNPIHMRQTCRIHPSFAKVKQGQLLPLNPDINHKLMLKVCNEIIVRKRQISMDFIDVIKITIPITANEHKYPVFVLVKWQVHAATNRTVHEWCDPSNL